MKFLNFQELDIIKAAFCQKVLKHFSIAPKRFRKLSWDWKNVNSDFRIKLYNYDWFHSNCKKAHFFANTNIFIETGHKAIKQKFEIKVHNKKHVFAKLNYQTNYEFWFHCQLTLLSFFWRTQYVFVKSGHTGNKIYRNMFSQG